MSFPSCFLASPLLINSKWSLASTEMETSKGGLDFAVSWSVSADQSAPARSAHSLPCAQEDWV